MVASIFAGGRPISPNAPCFVIAEAGVNHNGSLDLAVQLVDTAAQAGADAVKFQTFKADQVVSATVPKADYQKKHTDAAESQQAMLRRLELTAAMHEVVIRRCQERGILFMSTPFHQDSADYLDKLGVPLFKIPSGEITNMPFLEHVAAKGKPLIVSTGMCNLGEVEAAVECIENVGSSDYVLLHCVSNYPADPAEANLRAMTTLAQAFQCPVGYSDHTQGSETALAAVALGASVIEKHFTLDRSLPGPDHQASLEPDELGKFVAGIRTVESALGSGRKTQARCEKNTAAVARRSLVAARDIPAGAQLLPEHIVCRRPGTGLPPALKNYFVNRTAREHIPAGALLTLAMVA